MQKINPKQIKNIHLHFNKSIITGIISNLQRNKFATKIEYMHVGILIMSHSLKLHNV